MTHKTKWAIKATDGEWCVSPSSIAEKIEVPITTIRGQINRGVIPPEVVVYYKSNKACKVARAFLRVSYVKEYFGAEYPELLEPVPTETEEAQIETDNEKEIQS